MEVAVGEDATELKTERRFVDGTADGEEGGEVAEPPDLIRQLLAQRDRVATSRAEVFIEPDVDGGGDVFRVQLLGGFEEPAGVIDAISALEGHAPGVEGASEVGADERGVAHPQFTEAGVDGIVDVLLPDLGPVLVDGLELGVGQGWGEEAVRGLPVEGVDRVGGDEVEDFEIVPEAGVEVEKPVRDGQGGHLPEDDIVAQRIAQPFDGERGPAGAVSEFVVPLVDVAAGVESVDGDDGFVGVSVPQRAHGEHEDFVVVAGEDRVSGRNVGERGGDFTKDGPVLAARMAGRFRTARPATAANVTITTSPAANRPRACMPSELRFIFRSGSWLKTSRK